MADNNRMDGLDRSKEGKMERVCVYVAGVLVLVLLYIEKEKEKERERI